LFAIGSVCHALKYGHSKPQLISLNITFAIFQVWNSVSPRVQNNPEILEWLRVNTRPLAEQQA